MAAAGASLQRGGSSNGNGSRSSSSSSACTRVAPVVGNVVAVSPAHTLDYDCTDCGSFLFGHRGRVRLASRPQPQGHHGTLSNGHHHSQRNSLSEPAQELSALVTSVDKNIEDVLKSKDESAAEVQIAFKRMQSRLEEQLKCKLLALLARKGSMTQEMELLDTILHELNQQLNSIPKSDLIAQEPNMSRMLQDIRTGIFSEISRTPIPPEFMSEVVPSYEYGELIFKRYMENLSETGPATVFAPGGDSNTSEVLSSKDVVYSEITFSTHTMEADLEGWVGVEDDNLSEISGENMDEADVEEDHIHIPEHILLDHVEERLNRGEHFSSIATSLGLTRKSLSSRLFNSGWEGVYHNLSPEECRDAILSVVPLDRGGVNWGIRHVQSLLRRELKLRLPRQLVRDVLHTMQPGHMRRREVRLLFHGQYDVIEPMVLWHMDSYDKLAKWKFRIHGGIDGASHYVLWCEVAMDKLATTIFKGYKAAVDLYGHPICIWSDYAAEHSLVREDQERARPEVVKPFLTGSSVHNQRIEHFWGQVWKKTAWFYHSLFTAMCNHNLLDLNNVWHMSSLHMVFFPLIQDDVDRHIIAWNNHRVRKISENGRAIPSHIPEIAFQAYERQRGWLRAPVVSKADNAHYASIPRLPQLPIGLDREILGATEAQGIPPGPLDLTGATLPDAITHIRDRAYERGKARYRYGEEKYAFHLGLTAECVEALQRPHRPLLAYLQGRLDEVDESRRQLLDDLYLVALGE